jgi:hypothetical protein
MTISCQVCRERPGFECEDGVQQSPSLVNSPGREVLCRACPAHCPGALDAPNQLVGVSLAAGASYQVLASLSDDFDEVLGQKQLHLVAGQKNVVDIPVPASVAATALGSVNRNRRPLSSLLRPGVHVLSLGECTHAPRPPADYRYPLAGQGRGSHTPVLYFGARQQNRKTQHDYDVDTLIVTLRTWPCPCLAI